MIYLASTDWFLEENSLQKRKKTEGKSVHLLKDYLNMNSEKGLNKAMWLERVRKSPIHYLFLIGSINIPSISKSIFRRLAASLASLTSVKGPAITR